MGDGTGEGKGEGSASAILSAWSAGTACATLSAWSAGTACATLSARSAGTASALSAGGHRGDPGTASALSAGEATKEIMVRPRPSVRKKLEDEQEMLSEEDHDALPEEQTVLEARRPEKRLCQPETEQRVAAQKLLQKPSQKASLQVKVEEQAPEKRLRQPETEQRVPAVVPPPSRAAITARWQQARQQSQKARGQQARQQSQPAVVPPPSRVEAPAIEAWHVEPSTSLGFKLVGMA